MLYLAFGKDPDMDPDMNPVMNPDMNPVINTIMNPDMNSDMNPGMKFYFLRSKGDIELLREELARRVEESENTRQEMAGMAQRWEQEVRSIQETHIKERKEFDEVHRISLRNIVI